MRHIRLARLAALQLRLKKLDILELEAHRSAYAEAIAESQLLLPPLAQNALDPAVLVGVATGGPARLAKRIAATERRISAKLEQAQSRQALLRQLKSMSAALREEQIRARDRSALLEVIETICRGEHDRAMQD